MERRRKLPSRGKGRGAWGEKKGSKIVLNEDEETEQTGARRGEKELGSKERLK